MVGLASQKKANQHYFLLIGRTSRFPPDGTAWYNIHFRQCPASSLTALSLALNTPGMLTPCTPKRISCFLPWCAFARTVLSAQNALPQLVSHCSSGQTLLCVPTTQDTNAIKTTVMSIVLQVGGIISNFLVIPPKTRPEDRNNVLPVYLCVYPHWTELHVPWDSP